MRRREFLAGHRSGVVGGQNSQGKSMVSAPPRRGLPNHQPRSPQKRRKHGLAGNRGRRWVVWKFISDFPEPVLRFGTH
jgi:hypothetical protein